jgi:cysteinyl-tRNA synthetase
VKLHFYNSYSGQVEDFVPLEPGKLRMYHCGPTVYKRAHIGNYRAFLFADLLRRFFDSLGYDIIQVMNLTDVGHLTDDADEGVDKLEAEARRAKVDPWQIVERVSAQFFADLNALGVRPAHHYPKATDHIPEMVSMIETLIEKGHAYRVGDNVYFDVHSFPRYGQLSGNKIDELEAGARLQINQEKRHPADFALWKSDPHHLMKWDTVFGADGFPGWHIECSAMSMKYLGDRFDIHTGGEDNVFPHHECEIAQSESATGQPFVNLWMHTRFLQVDGGKMSKSLGNVYSLDDLSDRGFGALDLRFLILRGHYRTQLNFTWEALRGAAEARKSLHDWRGRLQAAAGGAPVVETGSPVAGSPEVRKAESDFDSALADDLNTPEAVAAIFTLRNLFMQEEFGPETAADALRFLARADDILGLFDRATADDGLSDAEIDALIEQRGLARQAKDWTRADQIRDLLAEAKIVLEDKADGVRWHRG